MYERLLDKNNQPADEFIEDYLGVQSFTLLAEFESLLNSDYQMIREMEFPFGNNYGWWHKYSHRTSHLCYVFEAGAFIVMVQFGDNHVAKIQQIIPNLLPKTYDSWQNCYPCGEQGGWVYYRVLNGNELKDAMELVKIKKKPIALY